MTTLRPIVIDRRVRLTDDDLPALTAARKTWADVRASVGLPRRSVDVFTSSSPKTDLNAFVTRIVYMAPASLSGVNVCAASTAGCRASCFAGPTPAGRGCMSNVVLARLARTRLFAVSPGSFYRLVRREIELLLEHHAGPVGVRLNGTSDLRHEDTYPGLFEDTDARVVFYDYTKHPRRRPPARYALTYSASERDSDDHIVAMAHRYGRSAVVVNIPKHGHAPQWDTDETTPLPQTWNRLPVVDGDLTDLRTENGPCIVALRAKGNAVNDTTGFVRHIV